MIVTKINTIAYLLFFITTGLIISCTDAISDKNQYNLNYISEPEKAGEIIIQNQNYKNGETIEITAIARKGWLFEKWSGDADGIESSYKLLMNSDKEVKASFIKRKYELEIIVEGKGSVEERLIQHKEYQFQSHIEIEAKPDSGWYFTGWSGVVQDDDNPVIFEMKDHSKIIASFAPKSPQVKTEGYSHISPFTVAVYSIVTEGGVSLKDRGVCITAGEYQNQQRCLSAEDDENTFSVIISGLNSSTQYSVYSFIVADSDTTYGNSIDIITEEFVKQSCGSVIDNDGNEYQTTVINDQCWMADNLRTTTYANGDSLIMISQEKEHGIRWYNTEEGAWSYYDEDPKNGPNFGKLYNFHTVEDERSVCPIGWKVPSRMQWMKMVDYLGGASTGGCKLKDTEIESTDFSNCASNLVGFNGKPGGGGYTYQYRFLFERGNWWTSTTGDTKRGAYHYQLSFTESVIVRYSDLENAYSIRCMKE